MSSMVGCNDQTIKLKAYIGYKVYLPIRGQPNKSDIGAI